MKSSRELELCSDAATLSEDSKCSVAHGDADFSGFSSCLFVQVRCLDIKLSAGETFCHNRQITARTSKIGESEAQTLKSAACTSALSSICLYCVILWPTNHFIWDAYFSGGYICSADSPRCIRGCGLELFFSQLNA